MSVAIMADRAYDGRGKYLRSGVTLLVDAGRIQAVEPRRISPPVNLEVFDLGDATLLPGFIDTHSHLVLDGDPNPESWFMNSDDNACLKRMSQAARQALHGGVTTLRDLGAPGRLAMRLREDWDQTEAAPGILAAGTPLTVPGGHGHFLGGEVSRGPEALRQAVRERQRQGADVIKVMLSGGRLTPGTNTSVLQFSDAEVAAVVDEAHRWNLPVTGHAYPPDAIEQAMRVGMDGIEHCFFSVEGGLAPNPSTLDTLAAVGTVVCPTIGLSPSWAVPAGFQAFLDAFYEVVAMMWRAGIRLVAGTDAGALVGKPHDVVPHSVVTFAKLGLDTAHAIDAATSVAAVACGIDDRTGAILPGLDADLVAVTGDPLSRPEDISRVQFVMKAGNVVRLGAIPPERSHAPGSP